ncbi:2-oxo-tetronate isomerase [Ferrimonas lipolytica]|uniref:Hydroxypyruvate isomerase family protein n=1 Tax=Ferrimonas lipolytica TaxID=2724191 RepID=A0A6H1UIM2_9GAMM|nr:2-oxo-tetronate isomerase [Ferrimonas lipolytica]QIZ77642.1 hydroxypyruvate isomerase family protein [Ferrimonas lipolytica]
MAKFAANLTTLFTELPFMERFAAAKAAGFEAVEFLFPYDYAKEDLAAQLQQHGLTQALFNMFPGDWAAGERGMAAIPGREAEFRNNAEQALQYAIALGCKKVHAMAGIVDMNHSIDSHRDTFINNLRWAADLYAEHGIEIQIEPLNDRDAPGYFLAHQRDALELAKATDRDNVKVQFDLYHAQIMDGDLSKLIAEIGSYIGHVQIASVPERHEPSEGELNYPHLFKVLDKHYAGYIGCEYHPRNDTVSGLSWMAQA